jgi:hypothetical protein
VHRPFAKRCSVCGLVRGCSNFSRNSKGWWGLEWACRACHTARNRRSVLNNHGGYSHYRLRAKYGIGRWDVDAMIEVQGGLCPICEKRPAVHVDHDHRTGRVREILCELCNGMLGAFRDDPAIVAKAIAYLYAHRADGQVSCVQRAHAGGSISPKPLNEVRARYLLQAVPQPDHAGESSQASWFDAQLPPEATVWRR